jgi:Flp pilus assembly protein TadG
MIDLLIRFWSDEHGSSAVELAIATSLILVPLLLGSTEIGWTVWTRSKLENSVRAGMEYVLIHGGTNATNIQNAARSATSLGTAITISPTNGSYSYCGCASSAGVSTATCGTTCGDGSRAGTYAGLTASMLHAPLFHGCGRYVPVSICPASGEPKLWSSTAVARIQ